MSQEERLMILQMVADKKITASEAAELLKALDGQKESQATHTAHAGHAGQTGHTGPTDQVGHTGHTQAPQSGPASFVPPVPPAPPFPKAPPPPPPPGAGLGSGLSAFIEEVVDKVTSAFGDLTFTGPRFEFPTEISGLFTVEQAPLRIFTGNGHVELKGWDQPGYKAQILVKARGATEAEARQRASEAYLVQATETAFTLETNRRYDWTDLTVHVTLYLPKNKSYRLESRTGNGHIRVEDVTLSDGTANSGNGRITFLGAGAERLYLKSGNGSIEVDGDVADLEANTGNGAIRVIPMGRRSEAMQLKTGNGAIKVDTGRLSREVGFHIDLSTGMGSVGISRSDLVYQRDDRQVGHKHVIARSQNYDTAERRVSVQARTGLGSISVE